MWKCGFVWVRFLIIDEVIGCFWLLIIEEREFFEVCVVYKVRIMGMFEGVYVLFYDMLIKVWESNGMIIKMVIELLREFIKG